MGLIQLRRLEETVEKMLEGSPAYLDYQLRKYSPVSKTREYLVEQLVFSHFSKYVVDGKVLPSFNILMSKSNAWDGTQLSYTFSALFGVNGRGVATLINNMRWRKICTK